MSKKTDKKLSDHKIVKGLRIYSDTFDDWYMVAEMTSNKYGVVLDDTHLTEGVFLYGETLDELKEQVELLYQALNKPIVEQKIIEIEE